MPRWAPVSRPARWLWGHGRLRIAPVPAQALGAFHVSIGVAILSGGGQRFSGAGWLGARTLAPWWLWGLLLTSIGACVMWAWPTMVARAPRLAVVAVVLGAVPLTFLALGFAYAASQAPQVSYVGFGLYSMLALAHLHLAVKLLDAGLLDEPRRH